MEEIKVSKTNCTTSSSGQFKCSDSSQGSFFKQCSKTLKTSCILSCRKSCSICNFKRASAKERYKTRCERDKNKTCQRCFFCKSLSFCKVCSKCPQCCQRVGCRGKTQNLLAQVARTRCKPQGSLHFEGGLCPTIQNETPFDMVSSHQKWLCKSGKKLGSVRGPSCTERKVGSQKGCSTGLPVLLQLVVFGPKAQQEVETHFGPQPIKWLSPNNTFKMETPETIRVSLQTGEWVTSLDFSDAYFHIPIHPRSRKYLRFFLNSKAYQFTALPFRLATAPLEFTKVVKEVKLMAQTRSIRIHQYLDDWLLRAP